MRPAVLLSCCAAVAHATLLPYPKSKLPCGAAGPLHVVSTANMTASEVVTLQTLAGVLARDSPSIYVVKSNPAEDVADDETVFWLHELERYYKEAVPLSYTYLNGDVSGLLRQYRGNITGYVWYEGGNTTNTAINYCAGQDG
eukprot:Hpha_TRINITY_DN29456_c0_g1::TRINITY_DN29456_c0_g1_i1::g.70172::m.70172